MLNDLITAAMQLAGTEDRVSHNARLWQMEGGRACPLGWGRCSQPVYADLKTGEYDYGEPGGPGHADCMANCQHGMNPPTDDDGDYPADADEPMTVGLDCCPHYVPYGSDCDQCDEDETDNAMGLTVPNVQAQGREAGSLAKRPSGAAGYTS
jgi:hypothetical protein